MKPSCLLLAFLLFWCGGSTLLAGQPSATASLSTDQAAVGEDVDLFISLEGAKGAEPPEIHVPGLDIRYVGVRTEIQMNNFDVTRKEKLNYMVIPRREGTFTIPALTLNAGGKKVTTAPLTLTVAKGASSSNSNSGGGNNLAGQGSQPADPQDNISSKFAFAEWVLPKTKVYVGEAIPAELRLYVDKRVQCQLQPITAKSDGLSIVLQKMDHLDPQPVEKDGRDMLLVIVKAAITPVKAGKLTLEPAEINAVAMIPQKRQRPPRMPGGFDSLFNDPFFNQAFNMAQPQNVTIRPDPVEMEVKALPTAGKPADFSGAIGQFTLETQAAPNRVKAGDPVTLTATVKGIGSFDRMNAPAIADVPGWRSYPPSGKFQQDDAVGISGEKKFEAALIPEEPQKELPPVTFSFFNPSTERYETLKGEPLTVAVEGAVPPPSPVTSTAAATPAQPAAVPTPTPAPRDIQYLRTDLGRRSINGFTPIWQTRLFWSVQGVAALAFMAFGGWQWRRSRNGDGLHQKIARLRREKEKALAVLHRDGVAAPEFFDAAIRVIQIETALARLPGAPEPATIDAELACSNRGLDCETAEGVRRIFAAHDELRYAGSGASTPVQPDQRAQVLQLLEQFETCHV